MARVIPLFAPIESPDAAARPRARQRLAGPSRVRSAGLPAGRGVIASLPAIVEPGGVPCPAPCRAGDALAPGVFVLDDHPVIVDGLRASLRDERGGWVVGDHGENTADLPARIAAVRANLVLVDLLLKPAPPRPHLRDFEGLVAIRTIRQTCAVKIIAHSAYLLFPSLRTHALEAGADRFLSKETSYRELQRAILDVLAGKPGPDLFRDVTGLELHVGQRTVVIRDGDIRSARVSLEANPLALLAYLAEERRARREDLLRRDGADFALSDPAAWRRICRQVGCAWEGQPSISSTNMAAWVRGINERVEPFRPLRACPLVAQSARSGRYALIPTLRPDHIAIH